MPRGEHPVRYHNPRAVEDALGNELPAAYEHGQLMRGKRGLWMNENTDTLPGTCQITTSEVDPQYEREGGASHDVAPNEFREMAGWIISQCVAGLNGNIGGFVTRNISNAISYIRIPGTVLKSRYIPYAFSFRLLLNIAHQISALNATFSTATMTADTTGGDLFEPGTYDPTTGGAIFSELYDELVGMRFNDPNWQSLDAKAETIAQNRALMERGHSTGAPWYGASATLPADDSTMTYECDSSLRDPQQADCSQLQYSQLGPRLSGISMR